MQYQGSCLQSFCTDTNFASNCRKIDERVISHCLISVILILAINRFEIYPNKRIFNHFFLIRFETVSGRWITCPEATLFGTGYANCFAANGGSEQTNSWQTMTQCRSRAQGPRDVAKGAWCGSSSHRRYVATTSFTWLVEWAGGEVWRRRRQMWVRVLV